MLNNPVVQQAQQLANVQLMDTMQRNHKLSQEMEARENRQIQQGRFMTDPWSTSVNEQERMTSDPFTGGTQFSHSTFERQAARGDDGRMYSREEKLTTASDGCKTHTIRSIIDGSTKTSTWCCPSGKKESECPHMITYSDNTSKDTFDKLWSANVPFTSPGTDRADLLEAGVEDEEQEVKKIEEGKKGSSSSSKTTPKGSWRS